MKTRKQLYHEYLNSEEWGFLRSLAIARNKRNNNNVLKCVDCTMSHKSQYDVHHEQYPKSDNFYSDDNSSYHVVLCRECHEKRHNINNDDMMVKIDNKPSKTFLSVHAAFYLYNPCYLGNYINTIIDESIDLDEYADLFSLVINKSKNNDNIKDFMCKLKSSNIDDHIIKEFAINTISFNNTYDEIIELKKECDKEFVSSNDLENGMNQMIVNSKKRELKKKQEKAEEEAFDINNQIINNIKKYKRKLKREF